MVSVKTLRLAFLLLVKTRSFKLYQSKADGTIHAVLLPVSINGWTGVKLSMSAKPYKGQSPIGSLFNMNTQCWREVEPSSPDYEHVLVSFSDWLTDGCPITEDR
jgi:hypothetical protein